MTYKEYREVLNREPLITAEIDKRKLGIQYGSGSTLTEIPIQVLLQTLDFVFEDWYVSKVTESKYLNMLTINVEITALHPVTSQYFIFSGSAGDTYSKMETTNKISKGEAKGIISITQSMAMKKACKPLGRIFGRYLNDENFYGDETQIEVAKIQVIDELAGLVTIADLKAKFSELKGSKGLNDTTMRNQILKKLNEIAGAFKLPDISEQKKAIESLGLNFDIISKEYKKVKEDEPKK
jgi:hypothetical protein